MSRRINTIFSLAVVFLLVLATNRIDKHQFEEVQETVNELFKDRVMVQDYIFKIAKKIHKTQLAVNTGTTTGKITLQAEIDELLTAIEETKLTRTEADLLIRIDKELTDLSKLSIQSGNTEDINTFNKRIARLDAHLENLSAVQISESRNLTKSAEKSLYISGLIAKAEIFFIICIGLVMQFLIFYRIKK